MNRLEARLRRNDDFCAVVRWCEEEGFTYEALMKGRLSHPKVRITTGDGLSFYYTVASSAKTIAGGVVRQKLRRNLAEARKRAGSK